MIVQEMSQAAVIEPEEPSAKPLGEEPKIPRSKWNEMSPDQQKEVMQTLLQKQEVRPPELLGDWGFQRALLSLKTEGSLPEHLKDWISDLVWDVYDGRPGR